MSLSLGSCGAPTWVSSSCLIQDRISDVEMPGSVCRGRGGGGGAGGREGGAVWWEEKCPQGLTQKVEIIMLVC